MFIDESHMTLPQVRAMYNGDLSRKKNLVDYGFRLPAAYDNRPLRFEEFNKRITQVIYVSATPAEYELKRRAISPSRLFARRGFRRPAGRGKASKKTRLTA